MRNTFSPAVIVLTALVLTSCSTLDRVVDKTAELVEDTKQFVKRNLPSDRLTWPSGDGVRLFRIDDSGSEVVIKVYREGRLAKLGHNHVIEATRLRGKAAVKRDFEDSAFELQSALSDWMVDRPEARQKAGKEFASVPKASDIESTRENMLGEKGLQADKFPILSLSGQVEARDEAQFLDATISLHGVDKQMDIPVSLIISGQQMRVIGDFTINQSDFGVQPLSLLFGSLRVRDAVDIRFSILLKED